MGGFQTPLKLHAGGQHTIATLLADPALDNRQSLRPALAGRPANGSMNTHTP
jgi:hypothetical protein